MQFGFHRVEAGHRPQNVYTFSVAGDYIIQKSLKCNHSATKGRFCLVCRIWVRPSGGVGFEGVCLEAAHKPCKP